MAKILLAVVAALCAFAAVAGVPALSDLDETELQLLSFEQQLAVDSVQPLGWPNATEILRAIEAALQAVQDKIQQVSDEVEDAVRSAFKIIEDTALALANKWNDLLQEWVDKANKAGVDIQDCINGQNRTVADVVESFKEDSEQCLADAILDLFREVEKLKEMIPQAKDLAKEAADKVTECTNKGNLVLVGICLAGNMPTIQVKTGILVTRAMLQAGLAAANAASIAPKASLCTATASARGAAEASAIVDATITCIKGKLGPAQYYH